MPIKRNKSQHSAQAIEGITDLIREYEDRRVRLRARNKVALYRFNATAVALKAQDTWEEFVRQTLLTAITDHPEKLLEDKGIASPSTASQRLVSLYANAIQGISWTTVDELVNLADCAVGSGFHPFHRIPEGHRNYIDLLAAVWDEELHRL